MNEFVETRIQNLSDIVPAWAKQTGSEKCLIQFFVSFFDLNNARAISEINTHYSQFTLTCSSFLRAIELHELKLIIPNAGFAKPRAGVLHWYNYIEEKKIEPGVYVILGAPFDSGSSTTETEARTALSSLAAMISLLYGISALHSKKCEFVLDLKTGQYSVSSPVIENPVFFQIDHAKDISLGETFKFSRHLSAMSAELKDLVGVALAYLDRAMREQNHGVRLSLYFSALEVLAGETSTNSLCKLLKLSHSELRQMGYDDLLGRRTLFVHKGQAISLKRKEERFLQYLVVDAISGRSGADRTTYAMEYHIASEKIDA